MMNGVQLQTFDLNLLVVFEVLMDELSVARAAERLARTPSAVSHSLARLRDAFGDPLLVKAGGKMRPSPLALDLIEKVRPVLGNIQRLVRPPEAFDAATSTRLFRIAGPPLDAVVAAAAARVNSLAPHVKLEWAPQSQTTYTQVVDELVDVGYGNAAAPLPDGVREHLLPELKRYVFARKDHPGLRDWSLATWLNWPHIVVALPQASIGDAVEKRIAALGLERKVGLRLPNWSAIGPTLLRTNMFASQNGLVFHLFPDLQALRVREPPISLPGLTFRVFWNARLEADPAQTWLRNIMVSCMNELIVTATERVKQICLEP